MLFFLFVLNYVKSNYFLNLTICMFNYIANANNFFYVGPWDKHGSN
jgi:hypothetical protein